MMSLVCKDIDTETKKNLKESITGCLQQCRGCSLIPTQTISIVIWTTHKILQLKIINMALCTKP